MFEAVSAPYLPQFFLHASAHSVVDILSVAKVIQEKKCSFSLIDSTHKRLSTRRPTSTNSLASILYLCGSVKICVDLWENLCFFFSRQLMTHGHSVLADTLSFREIPCPSVVNSFTSTNKRTLATNPVSPPATPAPE
jgi:hypothetical protein